MAPAFKAGEFQTCQGDTVLGIISIRELMELIVAEHEATISNLGNYIRS